MFKKKEDKKADVKAMESAAAAASASPNSGVHALVKSEIEAWCKAFKKTDTSEDVIVTFKGLNEAKHLAKFAIRFDAEEDDEAKSFSIAYPTTHGTTSKPSELVFSSDDSELAAWVVHMTGFLDRCKSLADALSEAATHFLALEGDAEDGGSDDEHFASETRAPVSLGEKKAESAPQIKSSNFFTGSGSKAASERLINDLKAISKSDTSKFGYSVEVQGENLYKWDAKLFDFDKSCDLSKDLKAHAKRHGGQDFVHLEMTFPKDYPFSPPFIRVVSPRFKFHTGHVTVGGSICMELLTRSGWSPGNDIESILVQIRANLLVGDARLDTGNTTPYSEGEAQEAFDRVARQHGWDV